MPTLIELSTIEAGIGGELISEIAGNYPELSTIDAAAIDGTKLDLTVRTDLPTVAFSRIGEGVGTSKGGYVTRTFDTGNLKHFMKVPKDALRKKPAEVVARYLTTEQQGAVEAAIRLACRQFYYGVTNDAKGFIGLIAQMSAAATHNVDATGGAALSSVYFVADGPNKTQWIIGNNQTLDFEDWYDATVAADEDATKSIEARVAWMYFNPGVRVANKNSVVRVKNIGIAAGKTATWDMLQDGLGKMLELGMTPNKIMMSHRTQRQLRDLSKTPEVLNPPLPKEFEGIPIVATHSISNAETI